jgi:protease-4
VDGYAFDDQVEAATDRLVGHAVSLIEPPDTATASEKFAKQQSIALVYVDGDMVDGRSESIPFLGMQLAGSYTLAETMKKVRESGLVRAVVLRLETPGGSSMAADVIWREVQLTAKVKPVIVSMGSVAASGGYYIAAPATRIFANPLSVTGSIGVFYGKADVSGLLRKIGVNVETYKTAPRADAESLFRPFSADERAELERKVGQFYDTFLSRVSEGRKMSKTNIDEVGRGRVWTGEQAKAHGLVDELGGLRQALEYARKAANLPEDAPIIELPKIETSLLGLLLGLEGVRGESAAPPIPSGLLEAARAMAPFLVHPPDKPLARLDMVPVDL